jgi:hypothetical protein
MRGRLLFVLFAEFARVDRDAMALGAPDVDPDFREPRILASEPDAVGVRARRELPPVRVPCQVEPESFEALHMVGAGNEPLSRVQLVLHFRDLEERGLVDAATGRALIAPGDRMTGFYDRTGTLVQTADLYVVEARPIGFGFGLLRPRRNLLLVVLEARAASVRGDGA